MDQDELEKGVEVNRCFNLAKAASGSRELLERSGKLAELQFKQKTEIADKSPIEISKAKESVSCFQ